MNRERELLKFGDYVTIEMKRYGVENEHYLHKVIGQLGSNTYVDVPVQSPGKETIHKGAVPVVSCICCGVDETKVLRFRVEDAKPTRLLTDTSPQQQEPSASIFACYLFDHHEGSVISEELVIKWLGEMLLNTDYTKPLNQTVPNGAVE